MCKVDSSKIKRKCNIILQFNIKTNNKEGKMMGSPQLKEIDADLVVKNLKLPRQTMKRRQEDLVKRGG